MAASSSSVWDGVTSATRPLIKTSTKPFKRARPSKNRPAVSVDLVTQFRDHGGRCDLELTILGEMALVGRHVRSVLDLVLDVLAGFEFIEHTVNLLSGAG
jgi:hypothetical protein